MRTPFRFFAGLMLAGALSLASCKKDSQSPNNPTGSSTEPELVENLNGYRFEGRFTEDDPDRYEFPAVVSMEEYKDSIRVHFTTLTKPNIFPEGYKWYVANARAGKVTRIYKPLDIVMPKFNTFSYCWNHPSFSFGVWPKNDAYATFYAPDKTKKVVHINKPNNNFGYVFTRNFTVFYESQGSVYLYEHGSETLLNRFVLSSEPSLVYTQTYQDPDYDANGYVYRANFITGFFNPTLFGNYVGIARGGQTLDTLLLDRYDPLIYTNPSSQAYVDKVGDTLCLGLIKRRTANISDGLDMSMFRMLPGETELKPVFLNKAVMDQTGGEGISFVKGRFRTPSKWLNDSAEWQSLPVPKMKGSYVANHYYYGPTRMYRVAFKDSYTFEIYSRPY